jgi:hypothetical protein
MERKIGFGSTVVLFVVPIPVYQLRHKSMGYSTNSSGSVRYDAEKYNVNE